MKFKKAIQTIDFELNTLVFARVIKTQTKEEHAIPTAPTGTDASYSYYYGFATEINLLGRSQSNRIWFKKNTKTHREVFLGPVTLKASDKIPAVRTIVVGVVDYLPKGRAFTWWLDDANALLQFCRLVRYQNKCKQQSAYLYRQLKLPNPYHDGLWAMAKLLIFGDILSFVLESGKEEDRAKHPVEKDSYTYKRGYCLRESPGRFVLATTLFSRDVSIYDRYMTLLKSKGYSSDGLPSVESIHTYLKR
jgi:hypothetical protein